MPSFLHVRIRRILGQKIGKNVRIKFLSLILSNDVYLDDGVCVGPLSVLISKKIIISKKSIIKPLSYINTGLLELGENVHIASFSVITGEHTINSYIKIGNHSRIFPFCWIDTGEGVEIGNHVGVGGHTLIFTHGVWSDYLDGGPVSYGKVLINDNVWLPWRVFVMPNVEIGRNTIVGANSLINCNIPENVLAAGSPAKVIKSNIIHDLNENQKNERLDEILFKYSEYYSYKFKGEFEYLKGMHLSIGAYRILLINDEVQEYKQNLLLFFTKTISDEQRLMLKMNKVSFIDHKQKEAFINKDILFFIDFVTFVRRFGIRLDINRF